MTAAAAVLAIGLTKEFERGRRTMWQRLRREPDRRERLWLEHLILAASALVLVPAGLWAFRSADRYVRVHGTIGQH